MTLWPVLLAILGLGAGGAEVKQAVGCPTPARVNVRGPGAVVEWWAEPGLAGMARTLASSEAAFAPLPGGVDMSTVEGARLYLLADLSCLEVHGLPTVRADWVAGVADGRARFSALRVAEARVAPRELRGVLRHELAHLALYRRTEGAAPRWLQEGYAQLAEGSWDWGEAWRLQWAFARDGAGQLEELSLGFPGDEARARVAYLLSYTAVQEIRGMAGERGLTAFLDAVRDTRTTDRAFRSVFGITESEFESRWSSAVRGRYGALYLLSRAGLFWTLVALLVVWAARRRRRIRRERNAALAERGRFDETAEWRADPIWRPPADFPPLPPGQRPRPRGHVDGPGEDL